MVGESNQSNLYSRQRELPLHIPNSVVVVGVGGVGSWVATLLAMSGVPRLYLYDPDTLDESNLNRVPLSPDQIGRPKVQVVRELIIRLRPRAVVVANHIAANDIVMAATEILFDCTDDWKSREPLYRWCQENKTRYMRVGYDGGEHLTIATTLPWQNSPPMERYQIVPSWVVPAVLTAAIAVHQALSPDQGNGCLSFTVSDLFKSIKEAL